MKREGAGVRRDLEAVTGYGVHGSIAFWCDQGKVKVAAAGEHPYGQQFIYKIKILPKFHLVR